MAKRVVGLALVALAGGLALAAAQQPRIQPGPGDADRVRPTFTTVERCWDRPADAHRLAATTSSTCFFTTISNDWDFSLGDQGFTTSSTCDASGGQPVWEWGTTSYAPGAPGTVWGTVLDGDYPAGSGEGLVSPPFPCDVLHQYVEVLTYYDIEDGWDGGNLTVNGTVVEPIDTYPATISPDPSYHAYCVDQEEGFTGGSGTWVRHCFDLSLFMGQTVQLEFDFGSDSIVNYPGWYLAEVIVGENWIPVELQSFTIE